MSISKPVSDDEYDGMLAAFSRSAFKFEMQDSYAIGEERADFERFLAGSPRPPDQAGWWLQYLDQAAEQARQGKTRTRVRVLAEPPTDYQRWLLWADPWYAAAGEHIAYMTRSTAARTMLPLWLREDWWLLDDERVIHIWFTEDGAVERRAVSDEPWIVARFCRWRDLAVRFAVPAAQIAAA
jgi:hypothetical protein